MLKKKSVELKHLCYDHNKRKYCSEIEAKSERSDKEIVFTAVLFLAEKGFKTLEV